MNARQLTIPILMVLMMTMHPAKTGAEQLAPYLYKSRLDNGLTVIAKETPGVKAATVQIWVKAGSVYEEEHEGGITHLIEHMIFKGTPTRGPGELAAAIETLGGRINAYTSYESTVYHATLSARNWQTALDILTDAVLHSTFDPEELNKEKKVVLEEIRMRNDQPNIKLFHQMMAAAYTTHPYRLPVIGTPRSVSSFTRDDIVSYMEKHYHPENFTVVVVGDVSAPEVTRQVQRLMGGLPSGKLVTPAIPKETARRPGPVLSVQEENINQSQLALSFPITAFADADTPALDVISSLLGHGEASRLFNQLRDQKRLVYRINASAFTPRDPGLFEVRAVLEADKIPEALQEILAEIYLLKYLPVNDDELERVKRSLESEFVFNLEKVEGQARILGSFEFLANDPREAEYLAGIQAITQEKVIEIANTYFSDDKFTVALLTPHGSNVVLDQEKLQAISRTADQQARQGVPPSLVTESYLPNVHRFRMKNGATLLVREDFTIPTVAIRAVFPGGLRGETDATNGAFSFIRELLPASTEQLSHRELALKIADMAGEITGYTGRNTFGLKADFLARFFEPGMELFRDILLQPAFSEDEAEKIRAELLSALKQQEDSLPSVTFREFSRILFQGHPYGLNLAGSETAIQSLTPGQLKNIYRQYARPENMVLAVAGAVKAADVEKLAAELFDTWQSKAEAAGAGIFEESILPPLPPDAPRFVDINRDKEQTHIIIGFLGTTLYGEDRFAMEVLENVLGGQSGRIFTELRDKQSLAYSLSSFSFIGMDTGSFGVYIGTSPDRKQDAIEAMWRELNKIRTEKISEEELQRSRNILIGHYELGLQTHSAQALDIALSEAYKLGQDFGHRYIDRINGVTREKVLEVAGKYLNPNQYIQIAVGPDGTVEKKLTNDE